MSMFAEIDPRSLGMARVGESVRFLGRNGHDWQLGEAVKLWEPGHELRVKECRIGGWESHYLFEGYAGHYNTVMFEPAQGTEAGTAETVKQGSVHDGPVAESDAP
jgi:hypothetical protein